MLKFIKGFGFEMEGGWEESDYCRLERECLMKGDGSVDTDLCNGEIASPVFTSLADAWKFMKKNYPHEVNRTCGFHVHISLNDGDYVKLMERDFYDKFLEWANKLGEKHGKRLPAEYKPRLRGENNYCVKEFIPMQQVKGHGNRYTQLNYCHSRHHTLENRMFPGCKKPTNAFFMLTQYLLFVEGYLKGLKSESKRHHFEVEAEEIDARPRRIKLGEKTCA